MSGSRPGAASPSRLTRRTVVAWVGLVVVVVALVLDRTADLGDGAARGVGIGAIVGGVVVAAIAYQTFSNNPPRTPRVIASVVGALVGGASIASAVTSAPDGSVVAGGAFGPIGAVGLAFACLTLTLESLARRR